MANIFTMSEEIIWECLRLSEGSKREPVYNVGTTIAWIAHIMFAPLDLGLFHWSTGFPAKLIFLGSPVMLTDHRIVIWALWHNEYISERIRIQGDRGQHVIYNGP